MKLRPMVLIVPFMELKLWSLRETQIIRDSLNRTFYGIETTALMCFLKLHSRLNRTFYGIETLLFMIQLLLLLLRLNRTFYGIETDNDDFLNLATLGLNRTFYGIETNIFLLNFFHGRVLIVPFMELKLL